MIGKVGSNNFNIINVFKGTLKNSSVPATSPLHTIKCDTFEKSISFCGGKPANEAGENNYPEGFTVDDFYDKMDKFNIKDYHAMSEAVKAQINAKTMNIIGEAIDDTIKVGLGYKDFLDKKYSKDGYVFVSIGVSPSLIAKTLECLGVETKYCPISQLSREYFTIENYDYKNYFEFLKSQGISPEDIEKSDKKFVFCDYTGSGYSLKNFERLMIEKLGLNPSKCDFRSANKDMLEFTDDERWTRKYIDKYFRYCDSDYFTSISHLSVLMIEVLSMSKKRLTEHANTNTKLFNFGVMDRLNEMGLLVENPKNENTL